LVKQTPNSTYGLDGGRLEQVKEFTYLGSLMTDDGKCINDIKKRVGLASAVIGQLYKIWKKQRNYHKN